MLEDLAPSPPGGEIAIKLEQSAQGPQDQTAWLAVSWEEDEGEQTQRLLSVMVRP